MKIKHDKVVTSENKAGCDDWNAEHQITNSPHLELIAHLQPSTQNSISLTNLDGNSDAIYVIEAILTSYTVGAQPVVLVQFNDDATCTNYDHVEIHMDNISTHARVINWSTQCAMIGRIGNGVSGDISWLKAQVFAKTGKNRVIKFYSHSVKASNLNNIDGLAWWKNTAANITKMLFKLHDNSNFTGDIWVYKYNLP